MKHKFPVLVAAGLFLAGASPAWAGGQIIFFPIPVWGFGLGTDIHPVGGPDSSSYSNPMAPGAYHYSQTLDGATAFVAANGRGTPGPALSVTAAESLGSVLADTSHGGVGAILYYSFKLIGPDGLVPTIITASARTAGSASGSGAAGAAAALDIYSVPGGDVVTASACFGGPSEGCSTGEPSAFALDSTFQLTANQYYNVYLSIGADATAHGGQPNPFTPGTSSASAFIDPYIQIDPSFPGRGGYTLWVTPGIGNAPVVPEPATWALMLAGCGGLGLALRRRRSRPAAA